MGIGWNELGFKEAFGFDGGDIRSKSLAVFPAMGASVLRMGVGWVNMG